MSVENYSDFGTFGELGTPTVGSSEEKLENEEKAGAEEGMSPAESTQAGSSPVSDSKPKREDNRKVLLVQDDESLCCVLKSYLSMNGYDVTYALDGEEGLRKFRADKYGLAIFDVWLPKKDGFTLIRDIKSIDSSLPVIFLSAEDRKNHMLNGYKAGAHDYVTKPFDAEVLLCKIKAILRRSGGVEPDDKIGQTKFQIGNFNFNSKLRLLELDGVETKLSPKESELLKLMAMNLNDLTRRELALTRIWHDDNYFTSRSMDVYIAKLRKYLKADPRVNITNIHGEGFRLVVNEY